jgi:hypothetical protein
MKKYHAVSFGIFIFALALVSFLSLAQEQQVKKTSVPKVILESFQKSYPQAVIKGYAKEKEKGAVSYEIESVDGVVHRDVQYSADGKVLSIEESIEKKNLPAAVQQSMEKQFPKAHMKSCEKLTKGDVVQFEVVLQQGKKAEEVVFAADGSIVEREAK